MENLNVKQLSEIECLCINGGGLLPTGLAQNELANYASLAVSSVVGFVESISKTYDFWN